MAEAEQIVISLILFAGLMVGMTAFSGDVFRSYDSDAVNSSQFATFDEVESEARATQRNYITTNQNESAEALSDIEENQFLGSSSAYRVVLNVFTAVDTFQIAVTNFVSVAGDLMPAWVQFVVIGILSAVVIFALVRLIFGPF